MLDIAQVAVIISTIALVVSMYGILRDRHRVKARGVAFGGPGIQSNLSITVSNSGKRPISIVHLSIQRPGHPRLFRPFLNGSDARIEVGASASTSVMPGDALYCWSSVEELYSYEAAVHDALGRSYKVKYPRGTRRRTR